MRVPICGDSGYYIKRIVRLVADTDRTDKARTEINLMAFRYTSPPVSVPDSPEKLILDLPRRKIKGVLLHQGEMMKLYAQTAGNDADVALQLPTGSGKTLVGLMIGEWRRRKFQERTVYLCPTRQLVNQVAEQAEEAYGLTVRSFTGPVTGY